MVVWLDDGPDPIGIEDGIVPAARVQEVVEIVQTRRALAAWRERTIANVRSQAQALVDAARAEAAATREAARVEAERAVRQGYEEGQRQAVVEWHERQAKQALTSSEAMGRVQQKLAEVVTAAVERIVGAEKREALYSRALSTVQTLTRGATALTLRVHASDHEHARAALASLPAADGPGLAIELRVDPTLKPGGCVFESDQGILDASLETQLLGLRAAMKRAVQRALEESDAGEAKPQHV